MDGRWPTILLIAIVFRSTPSDRGINGRVLFLIGDNGFDRMGDWVSVPG